MENKIKKIRNGGRPKTKNEDKKDKVISFRVDALTRMAIEEKVKESKLAMGEFLRCAVKNAEITPAEYEGYFAMIDEFNPARLLDLISASAQVVQPLSNEELENLKGLYRFARDVNALVKRGNASLAKAPADERINYIAELAHLQDEFDEIKKYYLQRVTGEINK